MLWGADHVTAIGRRTPHDPHIVCGVCGLRDVEYVTDDVWLHRLIRGPISDRLRYQPLGVIDEPFEPTEPARRSVTAAAMTAASCFPRCR